MRDNNKGFFEKIHDQRFVMQILIILAAVAVDQITKNIIETTMQEKESISIIGNIFRLTYINNEGASFGILQGARIFFLIATGITLVVLLAYMIRSRKKQGLWLRVCLSLITAGAVGNFIDRIFNDGKVRDFFDFGGIGFPFIFNVADMCLVVGSIMLGIYILFIHKEKDGKTLLARRDKKKDELLEDDEDISEDDAPQTQDATEKKPEKEQG